MPYYKTSQGAYLKLEGQKITSPIATELKQLKTGSLPFETKEYADVFKLSQTPIKQVNPEGFGKIDPPLGSLPPTQQNPEGFGKIVKDPEPSIVKTVPKPVVGVSQIDAGKQAITNLTSLGVSTDINTIRGNWSKFGLDSKLGSWIGSTTQWNAYAKYAKDELESIAAGVKEVETKTTALTKQVAEEGITPTQPKIPPSDLTPPTDETPGDIGAGGTALDQNTLATVTLSNTDIGDIITEIEDGTFAFPETVIAGAEKTLLTDAEKSKATQALTQFQQQMATSGQAFSSIRSSGEESLAAQSLARQSGINLDLASKIVKAARQEQTRRINAVDAQQKASTAALKSMGYVINPINGQLEKTLSARGYELSVQRFLEPERFSSGGSYFEYDRASGDVETIYQAPEKERNLSLKYVTDEAGIVTKIVNDPVTGEELYRENLGAIGKPSSTYAWMKMSGYDPSNPEDVLKFNQDWGIGINPEDQSDEDRDVVDDLKNWGFDLFR